MKAASTALAALLVLVAAPLYCRAQPTQPHSSLDDALELYQAFSGKTVIRSPRLTPLSEFEKPIPSSDTNGMRVVLEGELLKHGIQIIPHREIFALAVEVGWSKSPESEYLETLKPRATAASRSTSLLPNSAEQFPGREAIPPGTIDFRGADLNQVLDLYGMLVRRSLLRPGQIISSTFVLRTQTPLTKIGAIYLMEIALALNGIAVVEDGTKFMQVASLKQISSLKLNAPQPAAPETLINRDDIRQFGGQEFIPGKAPKPLRSTADAVVAYYAELTGRTAIPSERAGRQFVLFQPRTPLTKPELLYALETTLALNQLTIIEVDDKTIQAGYIHERINRKSP